MPLALFTVAGCSAAGRIEASSGWSGAVVADDVIYVGSRQAELLALDKENGTLRWSFPGDNDEEMEAIYGSPAATKELVFVGGYNGTLYALNPATQVKEWDFSTDDRIVGSPIVAGDTVIVGSSDGNLYALDAAQGFEKWRFPTGNKIWATPVVYEDVVYFGSLDHNVYAVTLEGGQQIWSFPTKGAVASTPLIMEGRVYIGSFDHRFYALDAATGTEVWASPFKAKNWFWTKAVSDGATIYVGSLDGNLYALDADSGLPVWPIPFETDAPILSAAALVPEGVAVANDKGDLFLVRTQDGREIRSFSTKDHIRAPLTASGSVVYISVMNHSIRAADLDGGFWRELWCYDTKKSTKCE
ncbi:MAG: PQQ-binding-like beta-propeller repeat protein [Chloroflexota bacterium]